MSEQDLQHGELPRPDAGIWQRLARWAAGAMLLALGISLMVHVIGLIASAAILVGGGRGEGPARIGVPVEVAIIGEPSPAPATGGGGGLPELPAPPVASDGGDELPGTPQLTLEGTGSDEGVAELEVGAGAGDQGESLGTGPPGGGGGGGSGSGGTSFFGVEARGDRFVFIVDVSGSMGVGGKIESLRRELIKAIDGLPESGSFLIIPFADTAVPLFGKAEWTRATNAGKRKAYGAIGQLAANGGTEPLEGFELAGLVRPRAHAVYFMTDGQFDAAVADAVRAMNAEAKIPVHAICFVSNESEAMMRRIATESGGTFTFVPGP